MPGKFDRSLHVLHTPESPVTEAYRSIRTALKYKTSRTNENVILVTSAVPGEGKTTVLSNLAILMAQDDKSVLLIDGDLRHPHLHHLFHTGNRGGLGAYLIGQGDWKGGVKPTSVLNLYVLPAGPIERKSSELLGRPHLEQLIQEAKSLYDFVLIDAPSLLSVTDAIVLARVADGIILVVRAGKAKFDLMQKVRQKLSPFEEKILGSVFNEAVQK